MALTQVPPALLTATTGTGTTVALSASPTFTGTVTTPSVTFSDASSQSAAASPYVLKNRIINGAMVIDQRNAGASVTPANGGYTLDRWAGNQYSATGKFSVQQNAGSVTPPTGFKNYLGVTSLSAYSVGTNDIYGIYQFIEGFNISDFGWGAAGASTVTLSFWVRSSLTGAFSASIRNGSADRSYPFSYTISSANTWEQKSVTIAGDTTGTWLSTNGAGLLLHFCLGAGSGLNGIANSWQAGNYASVSGATSVVGTNGATFYITGVQLEIGSSATPFERRLYNQELANCQRYYEALYIPSGQIPIGLIPASTSYAFIPVAPIQVTKRTAPTMTLAYTMSDASYTSGTPSTTGQWGLGNGNLRNTKTGTATVVISSGNGNNFAIGIVGGATFNGISCLLDFASVDVGKLWISASSEL